MLVQYSVLGLSSVGLVWSVNSILSGENAIGGPPPEFIRSLPQRMVEHIEDVSVSPNGLRLTLSGGTSVSMKHNLMQRLESHFSHHEHSDQPVIASDTSSGDVVVMEESEDEYGSIFEPRD